MPLALGLAAIAACLILFGWTVWSGRTTDSSSNSSVATRLTTFESPKHDYVGWSVCAECHANRVAEFQQTRHFLAMQLPDKVQFPSGFQPGANTFQPAGSPVRFEMTLQKGIAALTSTSIHPGKEPKTISPIAFVYGAGAGTDEVYFTRRGDGLFELPVAWLHPQQSWGAAMFDPYGTDDLSRPLTPQCLECHATWVDCHRGTLNQYGPLESHLIGVTCERCHGPAKGHVDHHRAHPAQTSAVGILHPKTLSRDRRMDLCAQCHTNAVRHQRPPFSYRPGEPLSESFKVLEMRYPEEDRVANQVRYLKESRCYQQSDSLTCLTCHDPHRKRSAKDAGSSSISCIACHQADTCGARTRLPEEVRGRCSACHMPVRNKVQVGFVVKDNELVFPAPRNEHRIAVYPDVEQEILYEWYGRQAGDEAKSIRADLGRKLVDHWTEIGVSAEKEQRFLVAIDAYRTGLRFGQSAELQDALKRVSNRNQRSSDLWFKGENLKRERRLNEAIGTFESLLAIEPNLSRAHRELGTLLAAVGRSAEGIEHLKIAAESDANDPGPHAMLGWLDFLADRTDAALGHYRQAVSIEPWSDALQHRLAQCLIRLERWDDAVEVYERALEINPNNRESCREVRRLLQEHFSAHDALPHLIKCVALTNAERADLTLALAEVYLDLDRPADARQILAAARRSSSKNENDLLPQVQSLEKRLATPTAN